ncbi:MAG TPA: 3-oxoacyl-[acyl-carrier-protein] reductase [Lachnospiraceae bacterium]|nr:3-oxoacyl-[acyl-carrier-protein] reductase [Lachnospiraceae bacterium]
MLNEKVAVITGGSRGIGRCIAKKFAQNHANVALIATKDGEEIRNAAKELSSLGVTAKAYFANVADMDEMENVAASIIKDFGRVDVLVNNAGITKDNLLMSMKRDEIDAVIDVNLKGCMYSTKAFLRNFLKQKSGNVINISSVVGMMGNKGQTNYSASKAGIIGFTKSLAKEYGKKNLRANAIAPGYIETSMTEVLSDEVKDAIKKEIVLGRLGKPEDVADLALFLASDMSSYITGEVIKVDGGMYV